MPTAEMLVLLLASLHLTSSYVILPRLTLAPEWTSYAKSDHNGPGTYAFGYDIEDAASGNVQFRQEEKFPNGTIAGSYGYLEPDGNVKIFHYTSDSAGFRVAIENSDGGVDYHPRRDVVEERIRSPALLSALGSLSTLGQVIDEVRTPLKHLRF